MNSVEKELDKMLEIADLPKRPSYRPNEVCTLLGISSRTFCRITEKYEPDPSTGRPKDPSTLNAYLIRSNRRVTYYELVDYFRRNNLYERTAMGQH
jgi:hypothetical protein